MAFKKTFICSTEDVNTYGFRVISDGIDLSAAKKNCPAYFNHKTWETPLGHWENLRLDNNRLLADIIIEGGNDIERDYIRKIENGDIKGASIGADPKQWDDNPLLLIQGQTKPTLTKSELFEISLAPLPGNVNALALKHNGNLITLSNETLNILPLLKPTQNMKNIALQLGLAETATEQQINDAVRVLLSKVQNYDTLQTTVINQMAETLDEKNKPFFIKLSKTNMADALEFAKLHSATEAPATPAAAPAKAAVTKDVKISELIALAKKTGVQADTEAGKETYDYLQKHNAVELARIHKDEPEKYAQLARDYAAGIRYNGR